MTVSPTSSLLLSNLMVGLKACLLNRGVAGVPWTKSVPAESEIGSVCVVIKGGGGFTVEEE